MQRGIRKKDPEPRVSGRKLRRQAALQSPLEEDDRRGRRIQQAALLRADFAFLTHRGAIGKHHRQRFVGPVLTITQALDRTGICRIDHEVKPANSLHGNDPALPDRLHGPLHRPWPHEITE